MLFRSEFVDAFGEADVVLVAPVHRPDKAPPDQRFSSQTLAKDLQAQGKISHHLKVDDMVNYVAQHAKEGDIIVTFSNGPFGGIHTKLLNSF